MDDCIFCKIVKGEIPSTKIYEDEHVLSFLDIMPAAQGHALVIPKKHGKTLLDVSSPMELEYVIKAVQKVGAAVVKATDAEGFNVLQSNHEVAGQVIPHLHFHIIPRKKDDNLNFGWKPGKSEQEELKKLSEIIKSKM